jgi:hypothetical protein
VLVLLLLWLLLTAPRPPTYPGTVSSSQQQNQQKCTTRAGQTKNKRDAHKDTPLTCGLLLLVAAAAAAAVMLSPWARPGRTSPPTLRNVETEKSAMAN